MRIAYFTDMNLHEPNGILTKLTMQCCEWLKAGHKVKVFSVPNIQRVPASVPNHPFVFEIFDNKISRLFSNAYASYVRKIFSTGKVIKSLKEFNPDVLYVRELIWYPTLENIIQSYPAIIELNTILQTELQWTASRKVILMNNFGAARLYSEAKGLVGVTDEITTFYTSKYPINAITVANGYDVLNTNASIQTESQTDRPQMIFVGSPGLEWHGIDKLCELAKALPEVDIHLVGPIMNEDGLPSNLVQHGFLDSASLASLYARMDIGIGTLALHRKNMSEASPLKVREYCAYGLPVIIAYKDTDLSGQDFILEIDNDDSTISNNIEKIKDFIAKWHRRKVKREIVMPLIDYGEKEKKRLDFMQEVMISARENKD